MVLSDLLPCKYLKHERGMGGQIEPPLPHPHSPEKIYSQKAEPYWSYVLDTAFLKHSILIKKKRHVNYSKKMQLFVRAMSSFQTIAPGKSYTCDNDSISLIVQQVCYAAKITNTTIETTSYLRLDHQVKS